MRASCVLLGGMGQVLLIMRPRVYCERLPSRQSNATTSTARGRHFGLAAWALERTKIVGRNPEGKTYEVRVTTDQMEPRAKQMTMTWAEFGICINFPSSDNDWS